ncbi:MAG TPA: tetraacyldisaccharide 4'-kinase [Polyangiaceae bacterium]|nr:tetraacyldisaccharide 4'-kinase [Polyangiaceae bacterium]
MIRAAVARALERGALRGSIARAAAGVWEARADVVREVPLPSGTAVIGVGGATLGGSYKTPLTLALSLALGRRGAVSVVGHGYGARVRAPRVVLPADDAAGVGDDAAWLARALAGAGIPVVVGEREAALAEASRAAAVVVVDGMLQALPRPLTLSLLAVDAARPWGSDACPPAGDRRASRAALLGATDAVVAVRDAGEDAAGEAPGAAAGRDALAAMASVVPVFTASSEVTVVLPGGRHAPLTELRDARVGVVLAVARADRILRTLRARGVRPAETRLFADHAFPRERGGRRRVDLWLTTPKCATKLGDAYEGATVAEVRQSLTLPDALLALCAEVLPASRR